MTALRLREAMRLPKSLSQTRWLIIAAASVLCGGCGGDDTPTIRGSISYNGTPATHGVINFAVSGQRPYGGPINPDGTYEAKIPPGEYQVRIDAPPLVPEGVKEGDPLPALPPRLIPEQYADYGTSGLTATVKAGEDQTIDFPLP
jgi:hypothetical protein